MSFAAPILASPKLTAILNGFTAMPEEGTIETPKILTSGGEGAELLTNDNAEAFATAVDQIVLEGKQLAEREAPWSLHRRIPLQTPGGRWLATSLPIDLESFDDDIDSDGGTLKGSDAPGFALQGPGYRYLRFDSREGHREITVGWSSPLAQVLQNIYIDPALQVWSSWYVIDFIGQAVEGLRTYLNVGTQSHVDLGVSLTNRIYNSGPYQRFQLGNPLLKLSDRRVRLDSTDERWFVPDRAKLDLDTMSIKLESSERVIPNGRTMYPEPIVEISAEMSEGKDKFMTLWLRRAQSPDLALEANPRLMLLSGTSLDIWSGAASWVHSQWQ